MFTWPLAASASRLAESSAAYNASPAAVTVFQAAADISAITSSICAATALNSLPRPSSGRCVSMAGGYGVSWNDDLELSEHELRANGTPVAEDAVHAEKTSRPGDIPNA